jgi:hypothetical protein
MIARLERGGQLPNFNTIWRLLDVLNGKIELAPKGACVIRAVQRRSVRKVRRVGRATVVGMKRRRQYARKP